MKIPENRIYKVRSTARQAAKIADPNLGAGPAAIARGMAPAIQGAIAATGQRIRNTLEEARNPHWLTHLKLAQTIAQTGAQVSRDLAAAYERRLDAKQEEAIASYNEHFNGLWRDHPDADGNMVSGLVNTPWKQGADGTDEDGPVKRFVEVDRSFDETDFYKGMSAESRARFDAIRPKLAEQYKREAESSQRRQMEQKRANDEKRYLGSLAANVDAAIMARPDEEHMLNFGSAVDEFARAAAHKMFPGEKDVPLDEDGNEVHSAAWNKAYRDATQAQWARRMGVITGAFELVPDLTDEDKRKADELAGAIRGTLAAIDAGGGMYTEEERLAAHAAWDASRMKRAANIEAGYRKAEGEIRDLSDEWALAAPSDAKARDEADSAAMRAMLKLPPARGEAAIAKYNETREKFHAYEFFEGHNGNVMSQDAVDEAMQTLSPNERKIVWDMYRDAGKNAEKINGDAERLVDQAVVQGKSTKSIIEELRGIEAYGGGGSAFMAGMRRLRDYADYTKAFEKEPEKRAYYDKMGFDACRLVFRGRDGFWGGQKSAVGADISEYFKTDKNGALVYDGNHYPILADGVSGDKRLGAVRSDTAIVGVNGDVSGGIEYYESTVETLRATQALACRFIASYFMDNPLDGKESAPLTVDRIAEWVHGQLGTDVERASAEMEMRRLRAFNEASFDWLLLDEPASGRAEGLNRSLRESGDKSEKGK